MTDAERVLWRALRESLPQVHWRKQVPIGPYFADFACFAEKLVIELDGGQHASIHAYDEARTRFIEGHGYRVLRFWNNDVLGNTEGVVSTVMRALRAEGLSQ